MLSWLIVAHPGTGFGLIGGLIAAADMQAKSTRITTAINPQKTQLRHRFITDLSASLNNLGYETEIVQIPEPTDGCWINVIDPTLEEVTWLTELAIPLDYIHYPLDLDERARMEHENGDILIIIRTPCYLGDTEDIPFNTVPLGIVITDKYFVTICKRDNDVIKEFTNGRIRGVVSLVQMHLIIMQEQ